LTGVSTLFIDILSGFVPDGNYIITVTNANQFTFTTGASGFASGSFAFGTLPAVGEYSMTSAGGTQWKIITAQNNYIAGTLTAYVYPFSSFNSETQAAGGNAGRSSIWTVDYYNGVPVSGTTGLSGGGAGGGGATASNTFSSGGNGGDSVIAGGGGGGGAGSGVNRNSGLGGSGGAGLVIFVYGSAIENVESQIIF
jgi:hypothetical protein